MKGSQTRITTITNKRQKKSPKKKQIQKNQKYDKEKDQCCSGKRKFEEMNETCDISEDDDRCDDKKKSLSVKQIFSDEVKELTSYFCKLLSGKDPPIQQVIECGVVPCLIRFLQLDDNPDLQLEAARAIAKLTASKTSDHKRYLIEVGVVPILIRLLSSMHEDVRLQAAWALGNLAGDHYDNNFILAEGALPALIQAAEDCDECIFPAIAYALSNLCYGEPGPDLLVIEPALPLLARLLSSRDVETVAEVCRALTYISEMGDNGIQVLFQMRVVSQLVELLKSTSKNILFPAVRTIANITKGRNTSQIQLIMSYDVLPCLLELLDHGDGDIRKNVCHVISNIASAGDQIQAVIDAKIFPKLIELIAVSEGDIGKEEALCAVYNTIVYGNLSQVWYLIDVGIIPALFSVCVIPAFFRLLEIDIRDTAVVALEGLEKILRLNQSTLDKLQVIITRICDCGGIDALERVRFCSCKLTNCASRIMDLIFDTHLLSLNDPKRAFAVVQYYRKMLGIEKNPPIQQVIDCGVVPFLIRFLQMDDNADLQLEAAGAIANIAFSNRSYYRKHVIEVGVVPILIRLLSSMNEDVRLQAAWGLGNLASENYDKDVKYRDILLAEGALPALIQTTENRISEQIIYAIGNLCDGKPFPDFEVIRPALPLLRRCLDSENEKIVIYSSVSLGLIARWSKDSIEAILDKQLNIIPRFIELLGGCTSSIILRQVVISLGKIACSNKIHAQSVLVTLPSFLWLLDHPDKEVRFNICWTLSKIIAGTKEHIQAVIDAAIFPKLIELLKSEDTKIQKRIALTICRATKRGTSDQVWYLINEGVIPPLCKLLQGEDVETLTHVLEGLKRMLGVSKDIGKFLTVISILSDCHGLETIEVLQEDEDRNVSILSVEIVKTFFHHETV